MANITSAKKRAKQTIKRHIRNVSLRSCAYTFLKKARKVIEVGNNTGLDTQVVISQAFSQIDKMVSKGLFHKNKAARLKSRLNAVCKKNTLHTKA